MRVIVYSSVHRYDYVVRDRRTKEKAPELRDRVVDLAFRHGLLVLGAGDCAIRLCPPLVITREQCDFAIETLETCLKEAMAEG